MTAYYNDMSPESCAWLTELAKAGHIEPGTIDGRSIADVQPEDLDGFTRAHFFAGIGGWDYALRLAGWPTDVPVWTGSAPCQPFSCAGKGRGTADDRHLWPEFARLILECRPPFIFGEQVASAEVIGTGTEADFLVAVQTGDYARANKLAKRLAQSSNFHYMPRWLDGIRADLEGAGYTVWSAVVGAHSVGAPHIRQRLYWVAVAQDAEWWRQGWWTRAQVGGSSCYRGLQHAQGDGREQRRPEPGGRSVACGCEPGGVDYSTSPRCEREIARAERETRDAARVCVSCQGCEPCGLSDAEHDGRRADIQGRRPESGTAPRGSGEGGGPERLGDGEQQGLEGFTGDGHDGNESGRIDTQQGGPVATEGAWSDYDIIPFRDGKARRIERQSVPVAHGLSDCLADSGLKGDDLAACIEACESTFPLAQSHTGRTGLLKGYGNAIAAPLAAAFVAAVMEHIGEPTEMIREEDAK